MDLGSGVDKSNIHQAELKPPCCQCVIGLELVWHCCQLQENPRCFLLPGLRGLCQCTEFKIASRHSQLDMGLKEILYRGKTHFKKSANVL